MAQQTINVGTVANDGTGDKLRDAMVKVNANFSDLYTNYQTSAGLSANIASYLPNYTGVVNSASYTVGTTTVVNATAFYVSNTSGNVTVSPYGVTISANGNGFVAMGNSINNTSITHAQIQISNSTVGNVQITPALLTMANGSVNALSHTIGTTLIANTTGVYHTGTINAASHTVGTSTIANATGVYTTGTVNAASHTVGSIVVANTSGITVTTNTLTLGTSTNAANGYTYLPNGFKMNWGWVSANSSAGNVTFTSAYTTNSYVVIATSNSTVATYQAAVISQNNTVAAIRTANVTSTNVFWQAIGI